MYASTMLSTYKGFSVRDVYSFHCEKLHVKENSGVARCLPDEVGTLESVAELDMSRMYLGQYGACAVMEVVRSCYKCEAINFTGCGLTNDIAKMLMQIVESHPSIQEITLDENPFLTTPCGDLLLKAVRSTQRLLRVSIQKTNVPSDIANKITMVVKQNRVIEHPPRELRFSFALHDALTPSQLGLLSKPCRGKRLCNELITAETPPIFDRETPYLPVLSAAEKQFALKCYREEDINDSGVVGYIKAVCALERVDPGKGVYESDELLKEIFRRLDKLENGFISTEDWLLMVRNHLHIEGASYKALLLKHLSTSYTTVGADEDTTALHASSCISNLFNIIGTNPPPALEPIAQTLICLTSGSDATDESLIPMSFPHYACCVLAAYCITDPVVKAVFIDGKAFLEIEPL